jgi:hypothetical protein
MSDASEQVVTFVVSGGVFGVGRLATKLNELSKTDQIGPWHIGQWIDFRHTAVRIKFGSAADGKLATRACIELSFEGATAARGSRSLP